MSNTKMKLYKILIIVLLLVLGSGLLLACGKKGSRGGAPSGENWGGREEFVYSIAAETVRPQKISLEITIGGDIQARNTVSITPDTGGTLSRVLVYEGEKVKKGAIIAYVDPSKAGQSFKVSPVRTPITGIVTSLPANVGNTVTTQQVIAKVADDSEIELKIAIPEKYVSMVDKETKGFLSVIALPGEEFPMRVKTISSVLSSNTHTMPATLEFVKKDERLRSGMYGSLRLLLETKEDAFVVRRDIILVRLINNVAVQGVYLVKDKDSEKPTTFFSPITTGIENNNLVEITSGLQEGDILVVQGQESLSEESIIRLFSLDGEQLFTAEDQIKLDKEKAGLED